MLENEVKISKLEGKDFESYLDISKDRNTKDIFSIADISGFPVETEDDYNKMLLSYAELNGNLFAIRKEKSGEMIGIISLVQNPESENATVGVFISSQNRNMSYGTTAVEEVLETLDTNTTKIVNFRVPNGDNVSKYLVEHFKAEMSSNDNSESIYKLDLQKHKDEYVSRLAELDIETRLYQDLSLIINTTKKSPERDQSIKNLISSFCLEYPNVSGSAIIDKLIYMFEFERGEHLSETFYDEDLEI